MVATNDFFSSPKKISLSNLAPLIDCQLRTGDDGTTEINAVAPIERAGKNSITFITNRKYLKALASTKAAAIICPQQYVQFIKNKIAVLVSQDPHKSFAKTLAILYPQAVRPKTIMNETGISPQAHIAASAEIKQGAIIEAGAVIGENAIIDKGTHIAPNVVIGANVCIGRDCSISANSVLLHCLLGDRIIIHSGVLIGNDGFGFAPANKTSAKNTKPKNTKVVQVGRVIIQDDVEIGAGTAVDRGTLEDTIIGEGTKIDNLVTIGHNVIIGRHCLIAGAVGIAGSSVLEDYVIIGGKVAIADHVRIGKGAMLAGASRVFAGNVPAGVKWGGSPARELRQWIKDIASKRHKAKEQ